MRSSGWINVPPLSWLNSTIWRRFPTRCISTHHADNLILPKQDREVLIRQHNTPSSVALLLIENLPFLSSDATCRWVFLSAVWKIISSWVLVRNQKEFCSSYYLMWLMLQKTLKHTRYGRISVKCYYDAPEQRLTVEILHAADIIALDANGKTV